MGDTVRPEGWDYRLSLVIRDAVQKHYDPRSWNCARFAHACAEAVSGASIPFKWRGSLQASADAVLPRIEPSVALRGDVVLAEVPEPSLGVCLGRQIAFVTVSGLLTLPRSRALMAWRV